MKNAQEIAIFSDVDMYLLFLSELNICSQKFYNFIQIEVLKSHTNSNYFASLIILTSNIKFQYKCNE